MMNDPIADLLTRIRNAQARKHRAVRVVSSRMAERVLNVLKSEGFIESFEVRKDREGKFDEFEVTLKYGEDGRPAIIASRRVSTPGRRVYLPSTRIPKVSSGLGISILSTSQGVMSDRQARKQGVGGEVLALIR